MKPAGFVLHPASQALLDTFVRQPAHAALLSGPVGIGKTHLARALAAELLGQSTANLENQPYYQEVAAVKDTISIEQIRTLIGFFRLKVPGTARVQRVALLPDADTMGREAQNALLKLLEEPPTGSVLLLTSSQPELLLPTIRSRAQQLSLAAPDQAAIATHLIARGYDVASVQRTLLRAGTNVAETVRLLSLGTASPDQALATVKQILTSTAYDRMLLVDGLAKQKDQASAVVTTLAATAMASLQAAAAKNPATITRWQHILAATHIAETALECNGNAKIVLTELMLAL